MFRPHTAFLLVLACLAAAQAQITSSSSSSSMSSSASGSSSGSGSAMFMCLSQMLDTDYDGSVLPPAVGYTMTTFGSVEAETCPMGVTQCVAIAFLNADVGEEMRFSGGCYDPTAPWVQSQEVMCMPGDDSVKVSLDGSFVYTCCDDTACNTAALLDTPAAEQYLAPDCMSEHAMECVSSYVETYGCLLENVRLTKSDDECARFLRPGVSCLARTCEMCAPECMRPDGPSEMCEKACAGALIEEEDYPSPGCPPTGIQNGECDIFCMTEDSLFDGGDCNGDGPGKARNHLLKLLARSDTNRDGLVSAYEAMMSVDIGLDDDMVKKYDFNGDTGLDWYELGLALREIRPLDDEDNMEAPLATTMEEAALNILQLVDKNLNGRADMAELNMLFHITPEQFEFIVGDKEDTDEVTAVQLMNALNIVAHGLMGMDLIDKVDVRMAASIAISFADYGTMQGKMPGMVSMGESKLLRFSRRMFEEIDENEDGMISMDELYGAIKEAGKYGCMGFKGLDVQETDIAYKAAPLRFPDSMCNILIMPEWNYEEEGVQYTMPPAPTETSLRRRRKSVRPRPPTLRNRDALHSLTRRKALLQTKTVNPKAGKKNSPRLNRLLSPRHVTRNLLQYPAMMSSGSGSMSGSGDMFDPMRLDPEVKYPFLVSLQTPQRICEPSEYLPEDYCEVAPWLVWDDIVMSGLAGPEGLEFGMTCLSKDDFDEIAGLASGPEEVITKADLVAKAFEEFEDEFMSLVQTPTTFSITLFDGPMGFMQYQAVAAAIYPEGPSVVTTGDLCKMDTMLDDYWWAILSTGAPPPGSMSSSSSASASSSSSMGSGSMAGSGMMCVPYATVMTNLAGITDQGGATLSDYLSMLTSTLLDCATSSSGSGSMSGSSTRRRLLSMPRNVPMDVEYEDLYQYCSGVLIDKKWVLTSAHCVGGDVGSVVEHDSVKVGGKNSTSGKPFYIRKVLIHPGYKVVDHDMWDMKEFDAALIELTEEVEDIHPIRMYDGMDLGYSDCHELMVKALGFPPMGDRDAAELEWTTNEDCDHEKFEELGYKGSVKPNMLCTVNDDDEPDERFMDLGGPLIAKPSDLVKDIPFVLIGITSSKEMQRQFYTRVSSIRQWVLAVTGRHPDKDLSVVINELELGDDTELRWFSGQSHTAPCPEPEEEDMPPACVIEECDIETGIYKDMGMGAITFSIQGGGDWEFEAELSSMGCGTECSSWMRMTAQRGCPEPMDMDMMPEEEEPACVPCTLNATWEDITEMGKHGKSFTGGLGSKAVHTYYKQYGVWVCVRDWDVTEQLACGAKPGEIVCFRFNEKEGGRFDYYGMNEELLLVKEDQAMDAMEKQLEKYATLMD